MSKSFEEILGRHSPETLRTARAIANRDSHLTAEENFPEDYKRLLELYNRAQEHYTNHVTTLRDENIELKAKIKTPYFTFKVFNWTFTIYKA